MEKVILKKLSSNENGLRNNLIEGDSPNFPEVGKPFFLFGTGVEYGTRVVQTSLVKEITRVIPESETTSLTFFFKTINSEYVVEYKKR